MWQRYKNISISRGNVSIFNRFPREIATFSEFCTEKYVAQIFLETYSSLYLPLHSLLRKQRNGSIAP